MQPIHRLRAGNPMRDALQLHCLCGRSFGCHGTVHCPWGCPWRDTCAVSSAGSVTLRGLPMGLFRAECPSCGTERWYHATGEPFDP